MAHSPGYASPGGTSSARLWAASGGAGRSGGSRDAVLFGASACAAGCGAVAAAAATVGCSNQVLGQFLPELGWLLLVPSALTALAGGVGLAASGRAASRLLRIQIAVVMLMLGCMLAAAGVFGFVSAGDTADWIVAGCQQFRTQGLWDRAGRVRHKVSQAHKQYTLLLTGMLACRALDPLVYSLSDCDVRGRCKDGIVAQDQPLYGFFEHTQTALRCGGFCEHAVPLFGASAMQDTLEPKGACAQKVAASVDSLGKAFGLTSICAALPVAVSAVLLLVAAGADDESSDEEEDDDPDGAAEAMLFETG